MKVIHTFIDKHNVLWKELAYSQLYSAILAKKHYGNISMYTTPELANLMDQMGFEYDEVNTDVVSIKDFDTWSLPKLKVFKEQTQPFLHIDYDTYIFNKIDFDKYKSPFLFSHIDMQTKDSKIDLGTSISSFINTILDVEDKKKSYYGDINNTYLRLLFKLFQRQPEGVLSNFDLGSIPNMNIVRINNPELFSKVCDISIEHYYSNKQVIDNEEFGPCYIEQLMLHQLLRYYDKEYKKLSNKYKHVIYSKLPYSNLKKKNNVPRIENTSFPYKAFVLRKHEEWGMEKDSKLTIKSIDDLKEYLNFDFGNTLHLSYMKWYDIYQVYIIDKLMKEIGEEKMLKLHSIFYDIYPRFDLPLKSGGEKLYEKLTNFSFKKVVSYKNNAYI